MKKKLLKRRYKKVSFDFPPLNSAPSLVKIHETDCSDSFFSVGEDIKCYYCKSRVSFKECDESLKHVQCDGKFGFDRCTKTYIKASKYTQETYLRGCLSASACEAPSCKARGDDTCEVSCCAEDYCNKSTTQMVSGTMVFILSALAVLIGQMFY